MPLGAYRLNGLGRYLAPTGRDAKTITTIAQAQVDTAQSKFGGASMLTDGNSDCLYATGFDLTGDWTMEGWYRINATVSEVVLFRINSSADGFLMNYGLLNNRIYTFNSGTTAGPTTLSLNTWYHLAYVKSGTGDLLFVNGVLEATRPNSRTVANSIIRMSGIGSGPYSLNGWSDEIRISKTARYTSAFTPPTGPFTNDSNTLILIHCDGTDASTFFEDDNGVRSKQGVSAIGNAQIDTAQSKFGGSSYLGDGSSDNLSIPDLRIPQTGNFTLECWFRPANTGERFDLIATNTTGEGRTFCNTTTSNQIQAFIGTTVGNLLLTSTTTYSANTWYHYAFVRNGNNYYLFLDGNLEASETVGTNRSIAQVAVLIGARPSFGNDAMNGHIDEVRISNTARYTANFTPSTTPFQNDSNTLLLLHMDGTDASTVFTDDNG